MAATLTKLQRQRRAAGAAGSPTVHASIDAFLDSPKITQSPHTCRAYTSVLNRVADLLDSDRKLARVQNAEISAALFEL